MRVFFIYDMFKILVLVCLQFTIPAVLSHRSPHADLVEELIKSPTASRYSNNIILDALLDVVTMKIVFSIFMAVCVLVSRFAETILMILSICPTL